MKFLLQYVKRVAALLEKRSGFMSRLNQGTLSAMVQHGFNGNHQHQMLISVLPRGMPHSHIATSFKTPQPTSAIPKIHITHPPNRHLPCPAPRSLIPQTHHPTPTPISLKSLKPPKPTSPISYTHITQPTCPILYTYISHPPNVHHPSPKPTSPKPLFPMISFHITHPISPNL